MKWSFCLESLDIVMHIFPIRFWTPRGQKSMFCVCVCNPHDTQKSTSYSVEISKYLLNKQTNKNVFASPGLVIFFETACCGRLVDCKINLAIHDHYFNKNEICQKASVWGTYQDTVSWNIVLDLCGECVCFYSIMI